MFIWNENGEVIYSNDKERVKTLYKIERAPDATLTDEEWKNCNGIVRVVNGQLQYGYTEAEKALQEREKNLAQISMYKRKLAATDYISSKLAEGAATKEEYATQLAERAEWRTKINELEELLKNVGSNQ